jgi:hypothetical protein
MIKKLVAKAKELGCIEAYWGKHMHVTEVATYDTTTMELKCLAATVNRHTNFLWMWVGVWVVLWESLYQSLANGMNCKLE